MRYRYYRNTVNRERKILREKNVHYLKDTKPCQWCEVKRIAGMSPASGLVSLRSVIHVDGLDHCFPDLAMANVSNSAFLDPMKTFSPLAATPPFEPNSEPLTLMPMFCMRSAS